MLMRAVLIVLVGWAAGDTLAPWWASAVYYRIQVDTFKDGDGDGLGDLTGITKQLSYIRAVGADAVIISPLMKRSADCSYGVVDFNELEPRYGTLATLTAFMDKAKKLELKVVITLPLQSVSTQSEWFKSSANRENGFEDYVLWRENVPDSEPNMQDYTWTKHEGRSAYYATKNNESILNLCSEAVTVALAAAQCGWLRRGFAGVVLEPDFHDVKCAEKLVKRLTAEAIGCSRSSNTDMPVILVSSKLDAKTAARFLADGAVGANSVISAALTSEQRMTSADLAVSIHSALLYAGPEETSTWTTSLPDQSRIATRYGNEMIDAINLIALALPGAAVIQQGDEIGLVDTILEWATNSTCWPYPPTAYMVPFSWDVTPHAGFSVGEPWQPVAPNFRYANAKTEFKNEVSHIAAMKVAAAMRKSPAIGPHVEINRLADAIAVLRWGGSGSLLVVSNLGTSQTAVKLSTIQGLPAEMSVVVSSPASGLTPGTHISMDKPLKLGPGDAILLAGAPRHCGGPGPVDKITNKLAEGWQKINKYFNDS